jgi:hypothetical protein
MGGVLHQQGLVASSVVDLFGDLHSRQGLIFGVNMGIDAAIRLAFDALEAVSLLPTRIN